MDEIKDEMGSGKMEDCVGFFARRCTRKASMKIRDAKHQLPPEAASDHNS
jgi:hypothetical protein